MLKKDIKIEFSEIIPEDIKENVLYISEKYKSAIHLCGCGCGTIVSTPIIGSDKVRGWDLIKNGQFVSLHPSIGNWSYDCKSHYWITNNQIIPA